MLFHLHVILAKRKRAIRREGIIVPLDRHLVVYPGGASVEVGASVEEVSLVNPGSSTPATPYYTLPYSTNHPNELRFSLEGVVYPVSMPCIPCLLA